MRKKRPTITIPKKKDLSKGNTINIINRDGTLRGVGTLIERRPSLYLKDLLPYVYEDRKGPLDPETGEPSESTTVIHSFERWLVQWTDHSYYRKGDLSTVECHFYVTTSTYYPSFDEPMYSEYDTAGRYIFVEDQGALSLGGVYQASAFKALKVVQKKFRGELVVYTHSPIHIKEQCEIHSIGRVLDFLSTDSTYGDAVTDYVYELGESVEDYVIIAGDTEINLPNTIQCGPKGLKTKNQSYV